MSGQSAYERPPDNRAGADASAEQHRAEQHRAEQHRADADAAAGAVSGSTLFDYLARAREEASEEQAAVLDTPPPSLAVVAAEGTEGTEPLRLVVAAIDEGSRSEFDAGATARPAAGPAPTAGAAPVALPTLPRPSASRPSEPHFKSPAPTATASSGGSSGGASMLGGSSAGNNHSEDNKTDSALKPLLRERRPEKGDDTMDMYDTLPPIKVVGIGGGGSNAVNRMIKARLPGVHYVAMNTDMQALQQSEAELTVRIGDRLTKGLGAGSDPLKGQRSAEESREAIAEALEGAEMVFVTACLGGGTGTGAAPIVAEVAREQGALTIGVVTKPFTFEGAKRRQQAEEGVRDLQAKVDTLIVIPNDRLLQVCGDDIALTEALVVADDVLRQAIQGISELITVPGLINLDFADVRKIMTDAGPALMAIGSGKGETRATDAAREAIHSPLLEVDIAGATGVLFNITGPSSLGLGEVNSAARVIQEVVDPDAEVIFGTAIDENLTDEVRITVVATGFSGVRPATVRSVLSEHEQAPIKLADIQPDPVDDTLTEADLPTFLRRSFPSR